MNGESSLRCLQLTRKLARYNTAPESTQRCKRTLEHVQLGIISVHAEDNGQVSVWATPGLLHGEAALADKVEVDADGDFPAGEHAALSALEHILDFTWTAVHVGGEPSKEGKHLAAGASGPLASTQAGTFHIQRVPVGTKHGTEGAAVHHSDVGDILALTVAGASTQTQWVAVRGKDASTATFWQSYQWWIMGAIFVANLGLRSWARGRGRGDAPAADSGKPSMQQAREARRSKSKSS